MLYNKWLAGAFTAAALFASASAHAEARVYFVEPTDGASVTNPVHVKFGLEGDMALRPAGDMTPDTGHHHLLIDGRPIPKGDVIPAGERSLHFGKAQTEAEVKLPPGRHTLTLQLGDGAHRSYGPELSQTIIVNVK
ncbi:DUF4399 domain-containing protein [Burkholderia thailandensis]|uniref:DUF4399 domain-containing protein n=2 Tax=Burkholderia thailandensis TaxID=57975 RepID=A0AAW9CX43_BURTH|nr:DUF4399 domain-containing protein [Burkholderia thailandensis]ABC37017.1 conserved hypothetical protein [Burkholderia thailandensis E264]AHI65821.1 hypothetical protein BTL_2702 [Burkholderia thailandensis H0587]AHI73743.1 hypothetical protein BTQ_959 [Burkholderia thailandensis 2002721723]AHI77341.1 hypothetical protein BTJ_1474 [Burkholderia thailandensis E444]AIC88843.1 hypothetical protein BTRA_3068 [Burkholderia thailandensis USAMRU Malaysia \